MSTTCIHSTLNNYQVESNTKYDKAREILSNKADLSDLGLIRLKYSTRVYDIVGRSHVISAGCFLLAQNCARQTHMIVIDNTGNLFVLWNDFYNSFEACSTC